MGGVPVLPDDDGRGPDTDGRNHEQRREGSGDERTVGTGGTY